MTYSTVAKVRKEAGDPHPEDVTDAEILLSINQADVIIRNSTQHDWQSGDPSFSLAERISEMIAASFVMDKYDDPKEEAENLFNKGMMLLQLLITEDEGSGDVVVASPEYKTWPLNPNAKTSRGRLSTQGIEGMDSDYIYGESY